MCGIAGYIGSGSVKIDEMIESIGHRGPDSRGRVSEQVNGRLVELGHTRLSILDLSSLGNQPMLSEDSNVVIVFNGEIYNFKELKAQYLSDLQFSSNTDTEVVLKMYFLFGEDFVNYLNGDFSIGILDKRKGKFLLIRDRCGVKPLYIYSSQKEIVFASEIKSIIKIIGRPEVNKEMINPYFTYKYVPGEHTLFRGILRVLPAHIYIIDIASSNIAKKRYWSPQSNEKPSSDLYGLVETAVNQRLVADVPIGNFLSGGVDSSIIASFLKNRDDIIHYCARKDEGDIRAEGTTSDYAYANSLAKQWGLNFKELAINSESANPELIKKTIYYGDDLIADGSQIPSYLITREAAKTSKVLLSGMGADELFFGYAGHQLILLDSYLHALPDFISNSIGKYWASLNVGMGSFKAYKRYLQKIGKYHGFPEYRNGLYSLVGDASVASSILNLDNEGSVKYLKTYFDDKDPFDAIQQFEFDNFLVKNLNYTDRMAMANSVEVRVPFLDHNIVEYAFQLKRAQKLSNTFKTKKILKDTFKSVLPNDITARRKAGFGMPLRSIFGTRAKIDSLLDIDFIGSFDYFNVDNVNTAIGNHINGSEDNSSLIYAVICFQSWHKQFIAA
jgi:asparagine synthase (glutamine-hydrolysing)